MIKVELFKGEIPRSAPRALPNECAQEATNARLLSGNLESWKNFALEAALCKTPPVNTIFLMDDTYWLQWADSELAAGAVEVDVAQSNTDDNGRLFITGLDVPRWTDSSLVASGSGCYPQATRPLGVPNPTTAPTTSTSIGDVPSIDITDAADQFDSWSRSGLIDTTTIVRSVTNPSTGGNPSGACYYFKARQSPDNPYMERDFGVQNSTIATMQADFIISQKGDTNYYAIGVGLGKTAGGEGPGVGVIYAASGAFIELTYATNHTVNSVLARTSMSQLGVSTWYKLKITLTRRPDGTADLTGQILQNDGVTVIASVSARAAMPGGFGALAISDTRPSGTTNELQVNFDNIVVQASGAFNDLSDDYTTSYVYTWVNDQGEESGPSPASEILVKDDGSTIVVTTPTTPGSGYDYGIVSKRIYRALTTVTGTQYYFLAEQLLWYQEYYDSTANADLALNEALETDGYELPPSDLRGIIALPNNIYAGFSGKQLCLSARGQPHAWPIENRYNIDTDIVAIGAIDAQVVILGGSTPYLAAGNEPSVFSMNNTEIPQGCVSKRSRAYVKGIGVVYASPDGLVAVAGTGQVTLLTEGLFSRKEWQALNPSSIIGVAHDNRYIGFYSTTIDNSWESQGVDALLTFESAIGDVVNGITATVGGTGSIARSTTQAYCGTYSLVVAAYSSYAWMTAGAGAFPQPGNTEDFTLGGWVYLPALTPGDFWSMSLWGYCPNFSDVAALNFQFVFAPTPKLLFSWKEVGNPSATSIQIELTSLLPVDQWFYLEVDRSGNTLYVFLDGVLKNTGTIASGQIDFSGAGGKFFMGSIPISGGVPDPYYLDELVVKIGAADHTSSFTPPGCYTNADITGNEGGFMIEAGPNGFGKVSLGFHASAVYANPETDKLYLVLDSNQVPNVGSGAGPQIDPAGATIYIFDQGDGTNPITTEQLPYRWRSKKYLMPQDNATFRRASVRAESYSSLWFLLYADGVLVHTETVTSADAFVLPDTPDANYVEFEIIGTDSVESVAIAHDVEDLEG